MSALPSCWLSSDCRWHSTSSPSWAPFWQASHSPRFRNRGAFEHRLSGFSYGFLIPIFFINVGIRFELGSLLDFESLLRALFILSAAFLVKIVPSMALALEGFELRETIAAGVLLSARLSLIIAVATVGVELGVLSDQDRALAILIAVVTTTLTPSLFRAIAPPPNPPTGQ